MQGQNIENSYTFKTVNLRRLKIYHNYITHIVKLYWKSKIGLLSSFLFNCSGQIFYKCEWISVEYERSDECRKKKLNI